ncbi:MAG TPA: acyl-CoA dehydrogenase family protein, partial [Acidimicrobiales bacterium]|nr:acyl-CoA dehydrogenase family protein [Acidimicrobiales bacterium]
IDDERGFTDEWWSEITGLGWPGLLIPEAAGGAGLGLVDAVVLQEEMGRVALPGPFLSSSLAATIAALRLGADDLLEGLAGGAIRGTVAIEEAGHGDPLGTVTATATPGGEAGGDGWVLDGVKEVVLDGHTADFAVVAARTPDGLAAFVLDGPAGTLEPSLDVTRKVARLDLSGRRARRIGPDGDQTDLLARIVDDIQVVLCAETVGAAERALQMAIEYAKQRVQFDRPIATFQAIKHKIVDMLHQLELARVGTHWAAWCSQVDDPLRRQAAAACKAFVAEAAVMVTAENIQVHGGVGFTWDLDCHLLFRRVKANDVLFGNQAWNRSRLADLVLGPA